MIQSLIIASVLVLVMLVNGGDYMDIIFILFKIFQTFANSRENLVKIHHKSVKSSIKINNFPQKRIYF